MEHIRGDRKGFFRAVDGSVEAGLISYVDAEPDRMIIDHTEVAGHYSGEGVGKLLVVTLAEYAREHAVGCMVLGNSGKPRSMLRELKQLLPQVDFHMEEYKG